MVGSLSRKLDNITTATSRQRRGEAERTTLTRLLPGTLK
jgi:hypothetical protein